MGYLSKLGAGTMEQLIQCDQTPAPAPAAVRTNTPTEPVGAVPAVQAPQSSTVTATADAPPELAGPQADQNVPQADAPPAPIPLDAPASAVPDDAPARQAHEAAEARRKAEFDAKQAKKNAARQAELDKLAAMSDAEVIQASTKRVGDDTEKLTRRNMKEAVCEHIQALCRQDAAFARRAMQPGKSMINCFKYINRRAQEYAEQEMKDNGIKRSGVYGLDVPDGLCYQWAVDYFNDDHVPEDRKDEEKFVPKPYVPKSSCSKPAAKPKARKETPKKEAPKKAAAKPQSQSSVDGQLSFMGAAG